MKEHLSDLAVIGSVPPSYSEPLHVGRPNIGDRERLTSRINAAFDRGWLTNNGPYVQELEALLAKTSGVRNCVAMCNATVALEIAIRALGMHGEVIVPSFTFIATAHALQWQQITPVFCDIDPRTHNIDPEQVERMITPLTTGIIGVHLWGRGCEVNALEEIASRHSLSLLFDSAHAFGCSWHGKRIGGFGRAEVFSFHATKCYNTLEGGAITTDDDELAAKIRLMKNFGFSGYDNVCHPGTNGKMNEISAAVGITNLESFGSFVKHNRQNYILYRELLRNLAGISLIHYDESELCNFQYVVLEIDEESALLSRNDFLTVLHAENILARRYFYPGCHRMEPYRSYFPHAHFLLPETERLCDRVLVLPTGTAVNLEDVQQVCSVVRTAHAHARHIRGVVRAGMLPASVV